MVDGGAQAVRAGASFQYTLSRSDHLRHGATPSRAGLGLAVTSAAKRKRLAGDASLAGDQGMTDQDAKLRLAKEIERAADSFGCPLKPGLATYIMTKLVENMPALIDTIKLSSRGKVQ
jgi:hypothetical protein